ncbi:MAG: hypothetical protein IJQ81_07935, partial [Oscillibacter sp.]|nr:hypothetical protein [Oscillibacter sp.]
MGRLVFTNERVLAQGKRGKLVYDMSAGTGKKIPGLNQPVVSYTDTDGKNKWVGVDTDEFGGVLYGGKRFASAADLVPTLLTPVTPTVTTPKPVTPSPAPTVTASKPVTPGGSLRNTSAARTISNYAGKALTGVGAAFVNVAGDVAGLTENWQQRRGRALETISDKAAQRYLQAENGQKDKPLEEYQYALSMRDTARKQAESAKNAKDSLYEISDRLAGQSAKFQAAAENNLPDVPALRGVLNAVTGLVPFFALNAIPVAGQAAAGAYLVGESTGEARRAGLSGTSQAALGLVSLLSMGAAGQVGKAIGNPQVTGWFLKNGMGPEFARVLEQAAVSGLASGAVRQGVMAGGRQAFAHAEQVKTAQATLDELSKMDVSQLTPDKKAAYDSAVAANQAVLNSGGIDFTSMLTGIALEMILSIGGTAIAYSRAKNGPNFQTSEPNRKDLKPEDSEYFQGVRTQEEANARLRKLARQYHPDVSDNPDATGIMQKINDEYDRLILDAKKVTETWRKAKSGGVTKAEAKAANDAIAGLLQTAQASGDAEAVAALERILAPMAAEINLAPVAPEMPEAVAAPETPVGVTNVPAPVTLTPSAPVTETAPQVPASAANLPAFAPVPERKPFITFEDWRRQHPEFDASAEATAKEQLAAVMAQPAPTPQERYEARRVTHKA